MKINPVILAGERGGHEAAAYMRIPQGLLAPTGTLAMTTQGAAGSRSCARLTLPGQDHQNPAGLSLWAGRVCEGLTDPRRPGRATPSPQGGAPAPSIRFPNRQALGEAERGASRPIICTVDRGLRGGCEFVPPPLRGVVARPQTVPASQASATRSVAPRGCGGVESGHAGTAASLDWGGGAASVKADVGVSCAVFVTGNEPGCSGVRSPRPQRCGPMFGPMLKRRQSRGNDRPTASHPIQFPPSGDAERCGARPGKQAKRVRRLAGRYRDDPAGWTARPATLRTSFASGGDMQVHLNPGGHHATGRGKPGHDDLGLPAGSPVNSGELPSRRLAGFVGRG